MTPYLIMLSESQERMLVATKKSYKQVNLLSSLPAYRKCMQKPEWINELQSFDVTSIPDLSPKKVKAVLLRLLASPNIASKGCVFGQYDHQVGDSTVVPPGSDAAMPRIRGTKKDISLTSTGNGRYCYVNPYLGGAIAVSEAARNLIWSGALPRAVTYSLNFGNPEKRDINYQIRECINGMARTCRALKIPVINGNVRPYNKTEEEAIYPTPVVGMVGLTDGVIQHCTRGFKNEGDQVFLLGDNAVVDSSVGSSKYLELIHGIVRGNPYFDLEMEKRLQRCCLEAMKRGLLNSANGCSEGGLVVALAECCTDSGLGITSSEWDIEGRLDAYLFGEAQSRFVVSVPHKTTWKLRKLADHFQVSAAKLGVVGGKKFTLKGYVDLPLKKIEGVWRGGLEKLL